jgi:hypothetical protein
VFSHINPGKTGDFITTIYYKYLNGFRQISNAPSTNPTEMPVAMAFKYEYELHTL